jgi:predicted  nucleic acid-binding Zn-ribbon protein
MFKIHIHPKPETLLPPFLIRILWDLPQPALPRLTNENYLEVAELANAYLQHVFQEQARAAKLAEYQATQKQEKLARQLHHAQEELADARSERRELLELQQTQTQAYATLEATLERAQQTHSHERRVLNHEIAGLRAQVEGLQQVVTKQQLKLNEFLDLEK